MYLSLVQSLGLALLEFYLETITWHSSFSYNEGHKLHDLMPYMQNIPINLLMSDSKTSIHIVPIKTQFESI